MLASREVSTEEVYQRKVNIYRERTAKDTVDAWMVSHEDPCKMMFRKRLRQKQSLSNPYGNCSVTGDLCRFPLPI